MCQWRHDNLPIRVIEIVRVVALLTVGFAFIPPQNDHAPVLVSLRRHNERNEPAHRVVARFDLRRVAGKAGKAASQPAVHFVVLVGRDPVVVGHTVVGQVERQLLQRRVVLASGLVDVRLFPPFVSLKKTMGLCLGA